MPFPELTEALRLLKICREHLKSAVEIIGDDADEQDILDEIEFIKEIDSFLLEVKS